MSNKFNITLKLIPLLMFLTTSMFSQEDKLFSVKQMHKDFDEILLKVEAHPDPYTHISEKDFMSKFNEVKSSISEPLSTLDFYKKVATIIALIKDGHTSARLPKYWLQKKRKEYGAFPYKVYLTKDDELYVAKSFVENEIPVPSKILSLNGVPISSFLETIDPFISYETKNFRNTIIDDEFEMYLYLAFGFSDNTEIEYQHADKVTIKVENIPYGDWKKLQKDAREEREKKIARGEPYDYKKIEDGVGMISVFSFSVPDLDDYHLFLGETFKSIAKDSIHSLIIDIRGNYGGWPKVASGLFHYITELPFKTMAKSNLKISNAYRDYYHSRYPSTRSNTLTIRKRRHYIDFSAILRGEIGTYSNEAAFFNEAPNTMKHEYKGDCYLMTNRDSYSAASSFASTFQCYQMGAIIGEETGGTKIFRANAIYTRLSRSTIGIGMSTTRLYTPCYNQEFEGVKPTVEYTPSIFEIGSDLDTQLLFTQRLIKSVQKKKKALEE